MPTPSKKAKKCQAMKYKPNTIFSFQATSKKTKFLEFDLKNAYLASLGRTKSNTIPPYEIITPSTKGISPKKETSQLCSEFPKCRHSEVITIRSQSSDSVTQVILSVTRILVTQLDSSHAFYRITRLES